mmetsp:Transcript_105709/g.210040  ORF Transcript_105709/g.210040 Transcript_105709/m.210040 type:complete len:556 (+) Transcript_105709:228-1895(+)
MVLILLASEAFGIFMSYSFNQWHADFWNSIQNKEAELYLNCWKAFAVLVGCAVINGAYSQYLNSMMAIRWRTHLTKEVQEKWLLGRGFGLLHASNSHQHGGDGKPAPDNPDQRLQEDIGAFVGGFMGLSFSFIGSAGNLCVFLPVLWQLSPPYVLGVYIPGWLFYVAIVYSLVGSFATHLLGWKLIPLEFLKQRHEADFRHAAVQVSDNTESIALYGSEATEHRRLMERFEGIQRIVWEQMQYGKRFAFFNSFYFQVSGVFPWLILAPHFFSGDISLGVMMQITGALGHVKGSLDWFIGSFGTLANFRATVDRLWGFCQAIDASNQRALHGTMQREPAEAAPGVALSARNVCINLPDGRVLWENAELEVQPKERVLLLGPDGCGKSLFLRALAGCWFAEGRVSIGTGGVLFVPQKPFVPSGTLHAAVAYPELPLAYSDVDVGDALKAIRLTVLKNVSLDDEDDWQKRLSCGEQQRLALAHALLRRPGILILDEASSAMGEAATIELYEVLANNLPQTAIVTVDHDANAKVGPFHNVHLSYDQKLHRWEEKPRAQS